MRRKPSLYLGFTLILALSWISLQPRILGQEPAESPRQEPPPAEAQPPDREIVVELTPGQRPRLRLAFPRMTQTRIRSREAAAAARELDETLRGDLERTRIFNLQGPDVLAVLTLSGDPARDFEQYRSLANEVLLQGELREEEDRLVFEARVYDLASGQPILGKRYRGEYRVARRIAHTFADELVLYFSGRRGIALTTIAFHSDRTGFKEIYLMDYDGWNQRRITGHKSTSLFPAWSPTGDGLAYVSYLEWSPGIYFVDLATGQKHPLMNDGPLNISPSFSPDGRRIAFTRSLDGNTEIFTADRPGRSLRRLTHYWGIDTNPAWSPTGGEIAFTSSRAGNPDIYLMDVEGTNVRRLTFEGDYNDGADWHPDGTRITYASRRNGVFQIAVTDVVTLETRVLTSGPDRKESPTYSPDGRKIAFALTRGGRTQIYVADDDGQNLEQLTREGNNYSPAWSGYPK